MSSHWNYRIIRSISEGKEYYQIHEVHYENNSPRFVTENPIAPYGDNPQELQEELQTMLKAFTKPILDMSQFDNGK